MPRSKSININSPVPAAPMEIWILVHPEFLLLDAGGPAQVFSTTNDEYRDQQKPLPYRIHLVSRHGGEVTSSSGIRVQTAKLPAIGKLTGQTLIVSGGQDILRNSQDKFLMRWLLNANSKLRRCCSVCNGALLLAQAGLLRHKRAVTHWKDLELLRRFNDIQVQDDAIYVKDGSIYTSAGISAGIDLCLYLIEEDLGRSVAVNVAKRLVVYHKRPGGQRQFSSALMAQANDSELLDKLHAWLEPRVRLDINVDHMAQALALSSRTLHRKLREQSNITPAQLLTRVRLEVACRLLESSRYSIKHIALKSGFGNAYNLRRAFSLHYGILPSEYRQRFS